MTRVDVSTTSDLDPAAAWALASDLGRFDEWMTIFGGWRSPVPAKIEAGTQVSSLIKVKAFRNVIDWKVTHYDEPKSIELQGRGKGGVRIALQMTVADGEPGSTLRLTADLSGGLLGGPIGRVVARVLRSDVNTSVRNLAALR